MTPRHCRRWRRATRSRSPRRRRRRSGPIAGAASLSRARSLGAGRADHRRRTSRCALTHRRAGSPRRHTVPAHVAPTPRVEPPAAGSPVVPPTPGNAETPPSCRAGDALTRSRSSRNRSSRSPSRSRANRRRSRASRSRHGLRIRVQAPLSRSSQRWYGRRDAIAVSRSRPASASSI